MAIGVQLIRRQLERVLSSSSFNRSERLSRLLRFVVERHLDGRDDALKESVIALEVFGNRDYDPKQDSLCALRSRACEQDWPSITYGKAPTARFSSSCQKADIYPFFASQMNRAGSRKTAADIFGLWRGSRGSRSP